MRPRVYAKAVGFLPAADAWDFPTVAGTGETLVASGVKGNAWLAPEYLRDGTVVAHLMLGDPPQQ